MAHHFLNINHYNGVVDSKGSDGRAHGPKARFHEIYHSRRVQWIVRARRRIKLRTINQIVEHRAGLRHPTAEAGWSKARSPPTRMGTGSSWISLLPGRAQWDDAGMDENKEPSIPAHPEHRTSRPPAMLMDDAGSPATHQMRVIARRRHDAEAKLEQQLHRPQEGAGST